MKRLITVLVAVTALLVAPSVSYAAHADKIVKPPTEVVKSDAVVDVVTYEVAEFTLPYEVGIFSYPQVVTNTIAKEIKDEKPPTPVELAARRFSWRH